jgi:hypothetical protein
MTELVKDDNQKAVQATDAPISGATVSVTTSASASAKTAAALAGGLYRITSTVEVSFVRGPFASVVAVAGDSTLPALPHVEYVGVPAGETLAFYDAGAGSGTVKVALV